MKSDIEEEIQKLKERDDLEALAIVGSYARNPDQEHNDIDILAIINGEWRKRATKQKENGLVIEIFYNSRKWFEKYIEKNINPDENWNAYHWLQNADIRKDPNNLFKEFREKAEEQKEQCFDSFNEDEFLYYIWDYQQDLEISDVGQKRHLMNELFNYLINQHFIRNRQPLVKENYKLAKLKEFDGYMYKNAQEFLTESSTMKKQEKLDKMIKKATKGLSDPKPDWETSKEDYTK